MKSEKLKVEKKARNEGRSGYKKTKVGWIPEEWECVRFSDVSKLVRGPFGGALKKELFVSSGYRVYEQQHAIYGDFDEGEYFIDESNYNRLKRFALHSGDIIMSCSGTAGRFAIFPPNAKPGVINQALLNIRAKRKTVTINFLYYFLNSQFFMRNLLADCAGGAIKNIAGMPIIKKIPIPLPLLREQKQIASILSAWDRAIEQVGKLMDAKQRLKKGLMQQLLTGRIRFPEFTRSEKLRKGELPEGWKACKLGACFKERRETAPDLPLFAVTSDRGVIPRDEVERKDTSNADKSKYKRITPGDIGYNTMRMWQGVSAVSTLEGIVSPAYTICTPNKGHSSSFFGYLFKYPPIIHLFHRLSQGLVSDTLNLKFHHFSQVNANVPSEAEQTRIAAVLSTCDREIELLGRKEIVLREQKTGLMQKLLTGEVRVKTEENNE